MTALDGEGATRRRRRGTRRGNGEEDENIFLRLLKGGKERDMAAAQNMRKTVPARRVGDHSSPFKDVG